MVFINSEGRINDNTYLIDGLLFRAEKNLALYVIENEGERMMLDTGDAVMTRRIVKRLKEHGLYPIHKLLLTHSHFDHVQGANKFKKLIKDTELEIMASEKAINNLKNPERMAEPFGYNVEPVENVTPLKDGEIINLNGLELKVINFFGHTLDSIAIFDKKNKNIFTGDAIIDRWDRESFNPAFIPPDFSEPELLKTFQKLRDMKEQLNSISLAHFGVWKDDDFNKILNEMEDLHFKAKELIIKSYNENPSIDYISSKYKEIFMPNSNHQQLARLNLLMDWHIKALKIVGLIH